MSDILKSKKLKVTPARMVVLEVFEHTEKPVSAEEVIKKVSKFKVDQVTVYRTLHSFEEVNIIRRVDMRKGAVFYELASLHHHHVICTKCGDVEDFDFCIGDTVEKKIVKHSKKFSKINDHSLELFSVCKPCIKNSKK